MSQCIEIAVFEVAKSNLARVLEVSEILFSEINSEQENIIAHQILTKVELSAEKAIDSSESDDAENTGDLVEVCWHLTWANTAAVQVSKGKWPTYPSSAEIQRLVGNKLYYGHFIAPVAN